MHPICFTGIDVDRRSGNFIRTGLAHSGASHQLLTIYRLLEDFFGLLALDSVEVRLEGHEASQ